MIFKSLIIKIQKFYPWIKLILKSDKETSDLNDVEYMVFLFRSTFKQANIYDTNICLAY